LSLDAPVFNSLLRTFDIETQICTTPFCIEMKINLDLLAWGSHDPQQLGLVSFDPATDAGTNWVINRHYSEAEKGKSPNGGRISVTEVKVTSGGED